MKIRDSKSILNREPLLGIFQVRVSRQLKKNITLSHFSHFGLYNSMDRLTATTVYDNLTAQFQDGVVQPPKFLVDCHDLSVYIHFQGAKKAEKMECLSRLVNVSSVAGLFSAMVSSFC